MKAAHVAVGDVVDVGQAKAKAYGRYGRYFVVAAVPSPLADGFALLAIAADGRELRDVPGRYALATSWTVYAWRNTIYDYTNTAVMCELFVDDADDWCIEPLACCPQPTHHPTDHPIPSIPSIASHPSHPLAGLPLSWSQSQSGHRQPSLPTWIRVSRSMRRRWS